MSQIGKLPEGAQELALAIVQIKAKAGEIGMFETMHALEPATKAVGWEMASILKGERHDHLQPHPDMPVYGGDDDRENQTIEN